MFKMYTENSRELTANLLLKRQMALERLLQVEPTFTSN